MGVVRTSCRDMVAVEGSSKGCYNRDECEDTQYRPHRFWLRKRRSIGDHARITTYLRLCRVGKEAQYGLTFEIRNAQSD